MRFVTAEEVRRTLTFPKLVGRRWKTAHRRPKVNILDGMLGGEKELYFARNAVDPGRFMGSKLITSFPANLAGGKLPAVQAVCVLFDGDERAPSGGDRRHGNHLLADGGQFGARDQAPGARRNPETLLVGRGWRDEPVARTLASCGATLAAAGADLEPDDGAGSAVAASSRRKAPRRPRRPHGAVHIADLITTCTRSHAPLIKGALLKPGVHLDLVGGDTS